MPAVAPARERGLKSFTYSNEQSYVVGRSREGAWIEIYCTYVLQKAGTVAPARERGLKLRNPQKVWIIKSRSREGAWIEIAGSWRRRWHSLCRSREGAWIEIL